MFSLTIIFHDWGTLMLVMHSQQSLPCQHYMYSRVQSAGASMGENHIHVSSLPLPVHQLNRLSSRKLPANIFSNLLSSMSVRLLD